MNTFKAALSEKDFKRLSKFIHSECGIKMPDSKKTMLESRLQKRLRRLRLTSFTEYCDYLFSPQGIENELVHMIDVVTTNKTDFFREPGHFDYLAQKALPELIALHGAGIRKNLMVWSAGCSTGEEPYTLAIVLSEFTERCPGFKFRYLILATDISTEVLEKAKHGIYEHERVDPLPPGMKKKYLLKGKNKSSGLVRIVPELRSKVRFRRLNFLEGDFGMREHMDIIFCRNVIIYFDRPTQEKLLIRFCRHLGPGGYIFMGHSETLHGMNLPLAQVAPTIYRKQQ
ncbi:MAG TPA: chemotaxis protein CheR [Nitrospirae bacterium]|nr:chemotaxis protein CheR [Nitrospirota bacterium]HDZ02454.1 chemotaxis protein CheR [Nitrospirota bacterium]